MATCKEEGTGEIEKEEYRKECSHYSRGCSFVSPCCGGVYPCRLCHDDKVMSHQIDRHSVMEIVCRKCSKRQPVGGECVECGVLFGKYFCAVCRLYDDADKGQFHCDQCGICRVGGRDNFYHCDRCGLCLAVSMRDSHGCRRQMSKDNCPVCMEDIHTSRTPAHVPNCGHLLHTTCYQEMMKKGLYQCPQCQTSLADMSSHWKYMDGELDSWQLPQHLQDFKVKVSCRDCLKETDTNFHVVGFKCSECGSYNTVRCGAEELPEDPNPAPGGLAGIIRRIVRGGGNQGGQDDEENDSSSSSEGDHNESSGNESDDDRGDNGPGNLGDNGNQQPDDTRHQDDRHDNTTSNAPSGKSPSSRYHDDGEVDDDSYDGDESDYEDESVLSESSEEFFDCSNHFQFTPRQRQNNQPIKAQTKNCAEWWESDEDNENNISETHLIRTSSPLNHTCHHSQARSRKPHPPIQVMAEQLHIMDIWGSDYFTDSFSEMSSESTDEEDTGFEGLKLSRRNPVPIKQSTEKLETDIPQNLTRMYSKSPSLTVPIQNGLHTQCACPYPQNTVRPCDTRVKSDWLQVSPSQPTWTRKSSSEESWATANEELGTLV